MQVLVLGATGGVGIELIRECLTRKYKVVVYARSPDHVPDDIATSEQVTIIKGNLEDEETLSTAIKGVDAIISALGPSTNPLKTHPSDTPLAKAYSKVLTLMHKHNVKRLITLGTASIQDDNDKFSAAFLAMVTAVRTAAPYAYKDVVAIGKTIRSAGEEVDWTIARVPLLSNSDGREYVAGYIDGSTRTHLTRKSYANFVVGEIEGRSWLKMAPMISMP